MDETTPKAAWTRFAQFSRRGLWEIDLASARGLRGLAVRALRVVVLVARSLAEHQVSLRAAALTYVTVFSLVPTLAVGFAMFKAFGGLEDATDVLLPKILDYLTIGTRDVVEARIREFVTNIHGGAIGGVGGLFLGLSAVSLLTNVERAFNAIWRVAEPRSLARRVTTYWTMATITPALLVTGMAIPGAARRIPGLAWMLDETASLALTFSFVLPLVLVTLALALLYAVMPNTRVAPGAALAGGAAAGALFIAAGSAYAVYAARAVQYSAIYGSLGVIPLFLLWIYVAWVTVLVGAEVAYAHQHVGSTADEREVIALSQTARETLALRILCEVGAGFAHGAPPVVGDIARALGVPLAVTRAVVADLLDTKLVYRETTRAGLVPGRDPRTQPAADVLDAFRRRGHTADALPRDATTRSCAEMLERGERAARSAWRDISIADLAAPG